MGRCPYIDDSASFMDGYHCKRIGGKVDEYDITRCYCNSSASYEYCPHYPGGDDRLRSKPEPEKPREMVRNSEERESVTERQETHKTTPVRRSSHGEMFKVLMGVVLAFGVLLLIMKAVGMGKTSVWFRLENPGTADRKDFTVEVISRSPDNLYETEKKTFNRQNSARFPIEGGAHDFWIVYDDCARFFGTWSSNRPGGDVQGTVDGEQFRSELARGLLVTLQDGGKLPILTENLIVTDDQGAEFPAVPLGNGAYVVMLPEDVTAPVLTFRVEGYQPLTVAMDLSQRLTGAVVTLRNS